MDKVPPSHQLERVPIYYSGFSPFDLMKRIAPEATRRCDTHRVDEIVGKPVTVDLDWDSGRHPASDRWRVMGTDDRQTHGRADAPDR